MLVFFFKQKTAYEMRISDWSSDVCSSDLAGRPARQNAPADGRAAGPWCRRARGVRKAASGVARLPATGSQSDRTSARCGQPNAQEYRSLARRPERAAPPLSGSRAGRRGPRRRGRSEEHTSELQSLMRISYAVFCLKKKKQNQLQKSRQQLEN